MSSVETVNQERALSLGHVPAWLWLGVGVYVLLLINGGGLLNDSDTYWHIAVGQWILDHHAMPRVDIYSFTKAGEPWISTSWFAQILFAEAYELIGWTGPIVVAAANSAENPPIGRRWGVIRDPMVFTIRHPPSIVPTAIAA